MISLLVFAASKQSLQLSQRASNFTSNAANEQSVEIPTRETFNLTNLTLSARISGQSDAANISSKIIDLVLSNNLQELLEHELTVEDIRQHRVELLKGINQTINSLPNSAFRQSQAAEEIKENLTKKPQSEISVIANLLLSDQLDQAITQLNALENKTDSLFIAQYNRK